MKINKITYNKAGGIKLIIPILFLFSLVACTKNFTEINTPTNTIGAGSIDASLLGQAFAQAQYRGLFGGTTEFQVIHNLYCDFFSQYFATTHPNFPSDQFQEVSTWTGFYGWDVQYGVAAPQVKFVVDFTASHSMPLANAMARVWKVYFFDRLTDLWGPIIYSQFGNNERSVAYDSQKDIYHDFFKQLDTAVAVLKANPGGNAFGNNDQIYSGNADKWLIYANSLRLRLAMRLSYVEPALAQQEAEKAVAAGVMTVNGDNASVLTTPINSLNFYARITYINEFRMSVT
ncbi:MAG: SusD/RagB family nutrient-binding outer membrane lipoprotein, partial [Ginsengibacter sp.]